MEKKAISEVNAVAAIMDTCFSQVEEKWDVLWRPIHRIMREAGQKVAKKEFARFNFALAVLAVNTRSTFDLLPGDQAERLFVHLERMLERNLGGGAGYHAVRNSLVKFTEAYNNGVLHIRNPLVDVATLLYYKIGMQNTQQFVVDESYYVPEPRLVDYLVRALTMFIGKWDLLLERYQLKIPN
ncbi:MAG: hypothetical protein AAGN35_16820 [Bacteroidota bacterium]